jgi:hypothetical protein
MNINSIMKLLNQLYFNRGYITARTYLPKQKTPKRSLNLCDVFPVLRCMRLTIVAPLLVPVHFVALSVPDLDKERSGSDLI